ncbi:MAG: hypothetical protein XD74_1481 [Actinobacteria bacterium 66_15]|nr:MAG: hypothetical protein XD74_1481 [Actinobacteria bacterium 66_15]
MEKEQLKAIAEALTGPSVLSYALKEDGVLVVIDQAGCKRSFPPAAYQALLTKPQKSTKMIKGAKNEQPQ